MENGKINMNTIEKLSASIGKLLTRQNLRISVAESCTGGLIGAALTDIAGSSIYFRGGIIAYDNEIKSRILNVPDQILIKHGAVSTETAATMAKEVSKLFDTECAISVSGIAGPGGGSGLKPVGLVHIGIVFREKTECFKFNFSGNRELIRRSTVLAALERFLQVAG